MIKFNTIQRTVCLLLISLFSLHIGAAIQNDSWRTERSTQGTDFWVTFMKNAGNEIDDKSLSLQLRITTIEEESSGTIYFNNSSSYRYSFRVKKGEVYTFTVPEDMRKYAYAMTEQTKEYKGVHVTSDKPISVYACNYGAYSYDATMVLPTPALGREYVVQTFSKDRNATEFAVVATASGTTYLYITPSAETTKNDPANKTMSRVTLYQGQIYFVRSKLATSDLSGSRIYTTQPVAVFAGNQAAIIPASNPSLSDDHLFEQVIPLRFWGQEFAVTTAEQYKYNIARVTAIYEDTKVYLNGQLKKTLQFGESYETRVNSSAWITTSRPATCYSYFTSGGMNDWQAVLDENGDETDEQFQYGDPSMVYIAPMEQGLDSMVISAFAIVDPDTVKEAERKKVPMLHYVNIVTKTSAVSTMTLNGQSYASMFKPLEGNSAYSYARIPIVDTISYWLHNTQSSFTAYVYGLGSAESYAYNAGFNNRYNDFYLLAGGGGIGGGGGSGGGGAGGGGGGGSGTGGGRALERLSNMTICVSEDSIEFRLVPIADGMISRWDFGDGNRKMTSDSIVKHKYSTVGVYEAAVEIEYESLAWPGHKITENIYILVNVVDTYHKVLEQGVCRGEKVSFAGKLIDTKDFEPHKIYTYVDSAYNVAGCDSITTLKLYIGVPDTAIYETTVCPTDLPYSDTLFQKIPELQNLVADSVYVHTLKCANSNCDSTIIFHLHVRPQVDLVLVDTICQASPYVLAPEVGQQIYRNDTLLDSISTYVPGTFEYTLSNGCDSTWNFSLLVTPIYNYYDSLLRVCDNDTISWQRRLYVGHKFAEPIDNQLYDSIVRLGDETYFDTIHYQTNIFGCDSIHYLRLQIQSTDTIFQTAELCATDSLIFDSVTYYFDSIQTDTVIIFNTAKMSSLGCDSIVQLTASVHPIYTFVEYDTVFQYDPYIWLTHEGHDYYIDDKKYRDIPTTVAGEFLITDYLQSQYGCDSTHYLHLFVAPTYQFDTTMYICDNDTISWHNILYIGDHFTDSVIASDYDTIVEVSKGTIIDSLMHKTIYGSDSLYTLSLVVRNTSYVIDSVSICSDTPYTFADSTYTFADWTKDSTILLTGLFETKYGCDSMVDLYLTVHPLYSIVEYDTVFQYKPYVWQTHEGHIYDIDGKKYSEISTKVPGEYLVIDYLSSQYGCDSTHYLHLFVAPSFEYHTDMEICDNDTVSWQNRLYVGAKFTDSIAADLYDTIIPVDTMAFVDSLLFQTVHGSDSLFVLSLTMHETRYVIDSITICDNEPFMFADSLYDFSDWHKDTTIMLTGLFETQFGCDSLVDLYLTIHQTYLFVEDTTICSNEPLTWRGFKDVNYWPSGTYYDTLKTVYGCDSVFQLNLNALPSFYNVVEMELCYNDTVDFQGQKVYYDQALDKDNQQHYYECRYSRQNGCDSVFRFIPIWLPAYHFYDTAVICQLDTVDWRGRRLTEPGIYTDSLLTQLGCDSIYQMFIGMDSTYLFIESDTICVGQSYEWRDSIYTLTDVEAGWYYQYERLQTQSGFCDSTYQLNLYVAPIYHFVEYDTVCESSLPYMWHEQAITDTIIHWDSLHTTLGYDSIYELHLHILPSQFIQQRIDICENDSFVYSQNVVYQAGVYIDSLVNVDGCDSIIEYTVVVHPNYHMIEKEAVCVGSDFTWHQHRFTDLASGKYEIRDTLTSVWGCDSVVTLQLLVAPTYHFIDTVTIAPGESFVFRGDTIDYAGFYHDSLTTTLGCDSIYSAYVTFLKVSYDTICTSERFDFNGQTLLETGVYYDSLKTVNGFDSVYIQHLQVNPRYRFITQDTICVGDVYEFRGKYYDEAGVYNDSLISSGGCDSIYQLHLIVHPAGTREVYDEYCNSEVYVFLGDSIDLSQFTSDTTLILYETIHNTVKCDSTIIYHVKVNPTYHFSFSDTVAINEPYTWLGHEGHRLYQGANQYTTIPTDQLGWITLNDSLHSIHGCDSVWTLNLYVAPTYLDVAMDTICYDDLPYLWRGRKLYETGIYNDTLLSKYLTDSVMQMQLYIRSQNYTIEDVNICYGDSFALSNSFVSTTGIYLDTLQNQYGCDSIVEYRLTVRDHYHFVTREIICEDDDYQWREHKFIDYPSGLYKVNDTLVSTYGCDSILTLQLVVATKHHIKDTATICPGEMYNFRGQLLTEAGLYHDTMQTTLGCDSIFSLHLSYLCTYYDTICQSETFDFHGRTLHETGVYYDSLLSVNGFDSVYIQHLQVNPRYSFVTYDTICRGDVYEFRGKYYDEAGVYNDSLISSGGCDSIYQLHLVVQPAGTREIYDAYCNSEVYVFMNDTIDLSAYADTTLIFYDTIHNTAKCDSTIIYHVKVYSTYHFSFSDTVAINHPYIWSGHKGHTLYQGDHKFTTIPTDQLGWISMTDSLRTIHGCDSIWTLNLYVAPTYLDVDTDTICYDDLPYLWRGRELYETGIYNDTLMSQYLTDSVYQMNLCVRPQDYTVLHVDLCEGDTYQTANAVVSQQGVYRDTLLNALGCDSIVEHQVYIHSHYHFMEKVFICESEDFVWREHEFASYASGVYVMTDSLVSSWGCDSIYTLSIVIAPKYQYVEEATICPGETYAFHGREFTKAGIYSDSLHTTIGCDSVFTLRLSYFCESYDTICSGGYFDFNGKQLTQTGVYVDSMKTVNGMDSVWVEYLYVQEPYLRLFYDTICSSDWYDFNGQLLNQTGVYYDTLLTASGCDSVEILDLFVLPNTVAEIYDTICVDGQYIFHDQVLNEAGAYVDTTLNIYGCQHIEYLYLTKVESKAIHISPTEFCADDTYLNFVFDYEGQRPISYTIRFSEEAKLEGFLDLTDQVITEDQVVSIPISSKKYEYPRPGDYTATILLSNGFCPDSMTMQDVEFRVSYPSWIMEQHWNDVISILVDSLNGGYTFSDYQWYYNGKPMYGENKPYLYVYPSLDMLGQYAVEVTRAGDGKKIMTCPIQPSFVEDYTTSYNATIVVTPTMMSKNNPNCTLYCDQAATWFLYTAEGESISQGHINEDIPISLNLPKLSASYFVVVRTDEGYVKFIKLLVQ